MHARKLQYLSALGIERFVPRAQRPTARAAELDPATMANEPVAAVRSIVDLPESAGPPAPAQREVAETSADRGDVVAEAAPAASENVPRFRLHLLTLAESLLLVDEQLLAASAPRSEQLQLLGDILRSARLLRSGEADGSIEQHVFYWPQVEDGSIDQGSPRAREALAYHLRQRSGGGSGVVLLVNPGATDAADDAATIALDSLDEAGLPVLEIDAAVLGDEATGSVRAAVWTSLLGLGHA